MQAPLKILFYNWAPFDDDEKRGGGVSVYQRNLVEALVKAGWQVDFLSSGLAYDMDAAAPPRIAPTANVFAPECRSFQLVNSPVMAPGHAAFGQNHRLFEKGPALAAFVEFLRANGPYDIVHFNNIEGIPFRFLDLKAEFPKTLTVLSHHNYFAVCPQVNLWQRETDACTDFDQGRACADCLIWRPVRSEVLAAHQTATQLKRLGLTAPTPGFDQVFDAGGALLLLQATATHTHQDLVADDALPWDAEPGTGFARRRQQAVEILNRAVDLHLAVSRRVAEVIAAYGIDTARTHVSYIGTKHGEALARARKRMELARPGHLALVFMGYMRADKGFLFLLDALEALPADLARAVSVTIAAKSIDDEKITVRLKALGKRLGGLTHVDGYSHADLPRLLQDADLGLVPVMWEDNMPQVALEIMSQGVPVLTSDRGGAQELADNPDFVFAAGSTADFARALRRFLTGEVPLSAFWTNAMALRSMSDHLDELKTLYATGLAALRGAAPAVEDPTPILPPPPPPPPALAPAALRNWILAHG